eukprot:TRINITY_DN623_c0_g1_i3.p1 TRINITY_DN623_c0_g1~~TRINITY_DN623_c0_g1_i3.p1  ORF type:complete len:724 (-),score=58.73 TRINITY_DN623_c0_g1_i3:877-2892(-)
MSCNYTNLVGLEDDYRGGQCEFFGDDHPLADWVGWTVVVGFGLFFSLLTSLFVIFDYNFGETVITSEQFNTAGRNIKSGLTASVIVSQWTWAATLLQSSNVAWKYGVSGPFWYAAGATIQVILFGILAIEIKRKAPTAHTILEIIKYRWGTPAHLVFLVFCFMTNIIVTAMLILGGAEVVRALTGVNVYAAAFLIPIGVIIYTAAGGLKATFIASYIHTAIIYIVLCIFMFQVYATNEDLGSISKVYQNLQIVSEQRPVEDNKDGSFLTILSRGGLIFGIINIIGNFGTVFVDQSYWQSAIAAKPSATYKGYILGGLCWFCIPFSLATTMGLASRALDLPLTADEAGSGLVPPATATHLLGDGGAVLILIMLFMAVTSTGSAEQIAVSSLVSYDIYRTYINPKATGEQIIIISRIAVCCYGVVSGVIAIILLEIGVNLGWVYLFMGIMIGSAVIPISFTLVWRDANPIGAMVGAISGTILALITWILYAAFAYDEVTVETTGKDYPMLCGNLVAIFSSGFICTVISLLYPQKFDWDKLKEIPMVEQDGSADLATSGADSAEGLLGALRFTIICGSILSGILIILWPVLAIPAGVFSEAYFSFWAGIAIAWGLIATAIMILLPLWESRKGLLTVIFNLATCNRNVKFSSVPSIEMSNTDISKSERSQKTVDA